MLSIHYKSFSNKDFHPKHTQFRSIKLNIIPGRTLTGRWERLRINYYYLGVFSSLLRLSFYCVLEHRFGFGVTWIWDIITVHGFHCSLCLVKDSYGVVYLHFIILQCSAFFQTQCRTLWEIWYSTRTRCVCVS